jgi:arsenite methyltransferase
MKKEEIKKTVREKYGRIAQPSSCCGPVNTCCGPQVSCCGDTPTLEISKKIGYTQEELKAIPEGADLGLGCGNPVAIASLKEGDTVLDLGSGAGIDCFLAAKRVGPKGRIIGVDMTPEMLERARENVKRTEYENVEFRLGEIEHLPVADSSIDVVISNCVINLSPDKGQVFNEAYRVLKPGGRLMVSDIVLTRELPESIKNSIEAYIGCVAGALLKDTYLETIEAAGFKDVTIVDEVRFPSEILANDPTAKSLVENLELSSKEAKSLGETIRSIRVSGIK